MLEAILVFKDAEGIHHAFPKNEDTLIVGWVPGLHPAEVIVDSAAGAGFSPFMVHSTSWRTDGDDLVLTFLVLIDSAATPPTGYEEALVSRAELARGQLMGPPAEIHVGQVVEHGLRHLAWLVSDDPAIHEALPNWAEALSEYAREPFRSFTAGG